MPAPKGDQGSLPGAGRRRWISGHPGKRFLCRPQEGARVHSQGRAAAPGMRSPHSPNESHAPERGGGRPSLADRKNGGILIDTWHYFRGAANPAQVRSVPADRFFVIQFDDADAVQVGGYMEDTTQRRRLPGQGAFDLIGFIQMLDEMGVYAPVSVEILSDEQRSRALDEAARLAHDTTRAVFDRARERRPNT